MTPWITNLSLEWYSNGAGVISAAVFRKDIDDPIYGYSEQQLNITHNGFGFECLNLRSNRNADAARVTGVEFSV